LGFKFSQPKISVRSTKERGAGHMMWLSEVSTASLVPDSVELLKLPHPSSRPLNPDIKGYSMFRISNFELILEQQYNKECFDRELSGTALLQTHNRNQNR
jgi:hypothetical protein